VEIKEIKANHLLSGDVMLTVVVRKAHNKAVEKILADIGTKCQEWVLTIEKTKKKRSLNANSYFHVLANKIAEAMNIGEDEAKVNLVLEYGAIMVDDQGKNVGFKLPVGVNVNSIYKYAKWFDKRTENGTDFDCFILYEHTHKLDSKQMARLVDGAVYECQELGIETQTPEEIERMKSLWKKEE